MIKKYAQHESGFPFSTIVYIPEGMTPKKCPVLISMHGKGESGKGTIADLEVYQKKQLHLPYLLENGIPIEGAKYFPNMVIVMPLLPYNYTLEKVMMKKCRDFVAVFFETDRIALMGLSFGGQATWKARMDFPNDFKVFIPIAGNYNATQQFPASEAALWAHHGAKDTEDNNGVDPHSTLWNCGWLIGHKDDLISFYSKPYEKTIPAIKSDDIFYYHFRMPAWSYPLNITQYLEYPYLCSIYANEGHPAHFKTYTQKKVWEFLEYHLNKDAAPVVDERPMRNLTDGELSIIYSAGVTHDVIESHKEITARATEIIKKYKL